MPGTIPNDNILLAIDQVIKAINDMGQGSDTISLVDKLEEIRTLYETRSVAEVTAQNTNFSDLIDAIAALTLSCQTIVNTTNLTQTISCGGSGSRGAGTYPADPSDQTTTPEDQAGDPPPGFASWAQFTQYQCDMAYLIINQMIGDIAAGGLLAATYATVATLAPILLVALLTPIGWAEIIIIVGLWITIWAAGVNVSLLSQLLEDNKEEFVCELLSGTSVSSSISAFNNLVSSEVDGDPTLGALSDFIRTQVKQLITSHATIDSINRLYEKSPVPPPGGNDCSGCGDGEFEIWWGCLTNDTSGFADGSLPGQAHWLEVDALQVGGTWVWSIGYDINSDWVVTITQGSLTAPPDVSTFKASQNDTSLTCGSGNGPGQWTVQYNSWPSSFSNTRTIQYRSGSAFRVRVDRVDS